MSPEKKGWKANHTDTHSFSIQHLFLGTIGKKLFLGFGFILLLLATMAVLSYMLNVQITNDTYAIKNVEAPLELMAEQVIGYDAVLTGNAHWALLHAMKGEWDMVKEHQQKYDETGIKLDTLLKTDARILLEQSVRPKEMMDKVDKDIRELDRVNIALVELEVAAFAKMNEKNPDAAYPLIVDEQYHVYKNELYDLYRDWADTEAEVVNLYRQKIIQNTRRVEMVNLAFGTIAVVLGLLIAFIISRSISLPIKKLTRATEEIEKGNLTVRVDIRTGDELQELGEAFNDTTDALEKLDEERKQIDAAKTRLLSITSHELRSPMTPMKAQLQMLETGQIGKIDAEQKESISMVLRNLDRLDKIIVDFLEVSRMEAGRLKFDFKKTDLKESVNKVTEFMKGFMPEKKIEITTKIPALPIIEIDSDRFEQVLGNLVNNAIKFSKQNGKVEVKAELLKDKNKILFGVRDYGIGISPENQAKLFEPFFQAEQTIYREHAGTGLGLAICRGIVEAQNGKIWVESEPGKGSTFYFTIPLTPVTEMKTIRVLFSAKENIESRIRKVFQEILGPMGGIEFEDLLKKEGIAKEKLFKYINELVKKKILPAQQGTEFRKKIEYALEQIEQIRKTPTPVEEEVAEFLKKR